ncbi:MAG: ABC transporter substrate-binding protein [Veillonellaceae bacterium]|nr:ABC transporter substrate-binding protein [Veillonellaceae bacterium]
MKEIRKKGLWQACLTLCLAVILFIVAGCAQTTDGGSAPAGKVPQRIAGIGVSTDDVLLRLVGPERMVTISALPPNLPELAARIPNRLDSSAEGLLALQPDLVIVPDWFGEEKVDQLRKVGLLVYLYRTPRNTEEISDFIREMGDLVQNPAGATELVTEFQGKLTAAQENYRAAGVPKKVAVFYSANGVNGGAGSLFDSLCAAACLENGAAQVGLGAYDTMTKEQLVALDPDLIFVPSSAYDKDTYQAPRTEELYGDPALAEMKAVQNHNIYVVDAKTIMSYSQFAADAVSAMNGYAYGGEQR